MQVSHGMDGTKRKKPKSTFKKRSRPCRQSVGDELDVVEADKVTKTNAEENKYRRTIILNRNDDESWGFTIQSYGIHHKDEDEIELLTYIDYVAHNSPAYLSGMRPGDVILSINGSNMEDADHQALIEFIKKCKNDMRMVVLFEDCCRKVELHHRYLKLKRVLAEKIFEMRSLEHQEMRVMSGLSRFDSCRSSRASSASSNSAFDDRLSLLPELDRCPSPRHSSPYAGLPRSPYSPDMSPLYSSTRSLSPAPQQARRFDFDRSSLPNRKHRPHSLAASVSVHAALNASMRQAQEASGGSSTSLSPYSEISPIRELSNGERSPQYKRAARQRLACSTPDYSLPPPNRSLRRSGRHASAPDKLNPPPCNLSEELELSLFKLHISGAEAGESSTEAPDGSSSTNSVTASPMVHPGVHPKSPPKTSSLPQLSDYAETRGTDIRCSALSLNSSGGSANMALDDYSYQCDSLAESDPGTPYSASSASSIDSSFSYSDLPAVRSDMVNDEDAVSHL